jgi:hypothetical protein
MPIILMSSNSCTNARHEQQIENSHERVNHREKEAVDDFVLALNNTQMMFRAAHSSRIKNVLADVNALKAESFNDLFC